MGTPFIFFGILAILFLYILLLVQLRRETGYSDTYYLIIPFVIAISIIVLGITMSLNYKSVESKSIVTPDLIIECKNQKCDTTYVYNFN